MRFFGKKPLGAAEIRAAIVVTDNGNAGGVNQIAATGATLQEGLLLSVTLASPIYSNGSLYLALNSGTAYQAICATVKGAGYRGVSTGEVEAGIPYLFQWSTIGGGRWILQSRSYLAPGDMPELGSTRCSRNTDQTGISGDSTFHTITFNSVDFNTGSNFSWSGGVATCLVAGRYAAASQLFLSTGGYHAIRHNSAQKAAIFSAEVWTQCFLPPVDLQVGDTIDCRVRTASTATAYYTDVGAVGSLASWLAIWRVK